APAAPARRAASSTARRSTSVMAEGTQITTRGRLNRDTPARLSNSRIMRWVMSKSVMAPLRNGRTAWMYPGVRPIICQASWPIASTSCVWMLRAMTVGSFRTMPWPLAYTRVLAVPRSMARSLAIGFPVPALGGQRLELPGERVDARLQRGGPPVPQPQDERAERGQHDGDEEVQQARHRRTSVPHSASVSPQATPSDQVSCFQMGTSAL